MLRTLRAFLLVGPLAFVLVLSAFLASHPKAPEMFSAYPFMSDALGPGAAKHPVLRFAVTSTFFFVPPYLALGLLLLLSEIGVGAAAALWAGRKRGRAAASFKEGQASTSMDAYSGFKGFLEISSGLICEFPGSPSKWNAKILSGPNS